MCGAEAHTDGPVGTDRCAKEGVQFNISDSNVPRPITNDSRTSWSSPYAFPKRRGSLSPPPPSPAPSLFPLFFSLWYRHQRCCKNRAVVRLPCRSLSPKLHSQCSICDLIQVHVIHILFHIRFSHIPGLPPEMRFWAVQTCACRICSSH